MKRLTLACVALVVLGVLLWLIVTNDGIRGDFDKTAPLADWLVALGTGGLALATFVLAREARNEANLVKRQVEIDAEQLVAAQRPLVLPVLGTEIDGTPHLLEKNAGVGPAMNIRGALYWTGTAGGASSLRRSRYCRLRSDPVSALRADSPRFTNPFTIRPVSGFPPTWG